jgi:hypothetical protein
VGVGRAERTLDHGTGARAIHAETTPGRIAPRLEPFHGHAAGKRRVDTLALPSVDLGRQLVGVDAHHGRDLRGREQPTEPRHEIAHDTRRSPQLERARRGGARVKDEPQSRRVDRVCGASDPDAERLRPQLAAELVGARASAGSVEARERCSAHFDAGQHLARPVPAVQRVGEHRHREQHREPPRR